MSIALKAHGGLARGRSLGGGSFRRREGTTIFRDSISVKENDVPFFLM